MAAAASKNIPAPVLSRGTESPRHSVKWRKCSRLAEGRASARLIIAGGVASLKRFFLAQEEKLCVRLCIFHRNQEIVKYTLRKYLRHRRAEKKLCARAEANRALQRCKKNNLRSRRNINKSLTKKRADGIIMAVEMALCAKSANWRE